MNKPETVIRTLARILSVVILLVWGYFAIAHVIGDAASPSRPLAAYDFFGIAAMLVALAGLAVAWKWEFAGAAVTLVAVVIGAIINWRILVFPLTMIPINSLLFLACGWMRKARR